MPKGCFSRPILQHFGPKKRSLSPLLGCKSHETVIKGVHSSSRLVPMQMKDMLGTQAALERAFFDYF